MNASLKKGLWKLTKKINSKSSQNGPLGVPGEVPGPPWGLPGAGRARFLDKTRNRRKIRRLWAGSRDVPGGPRGPGWPQPGPQNRQKTELWLKKWPRGTSLEAFFVNFARRRHPESIFRPKNVVFSYFFIHFFRKKTRFESCSCFFLHGRQTLKISVFPRKTQVFKKSRFSRVGDFVTFRSKKHRNFSPKLNCDRFFKKTPQNVVRGPVLCPKMVPN